MTANLEDSLLAVRGLHVGYGDVEVLKGIDLDVRRGEIVALLGANGAGKTTTINAVMGLLAPSKGSIVLDGQPVAGRRAYAVSRLGIALSPEGRKLFPTLTVRENLLMGAYARRDRSEIGADVRQWLDTFPVLEERLKQQAGTLSGGEQQMLAIARALMGRPRLLLLDEPSLGMAPLVIRTLRDAIRAINDRYGTTVLLVEQNADLALGLASRGYVLMLGRVVQSGTSAELARSRDLQAAYLGERRQG